MKLDGPGIKQVRPSHHPNPAISFLWNKGQAIVDLVYQPSNGLRFIVREGTSIRCVERYAQYLPLGWLAQYAIGGAVLLPSESARMESLDALATEIRSFVHRYFDCPAEFESVAVLYCLLTWVYEACRAVPYLRLIGLPGSGKSRGTETIGSLCYRAVSMSGATTSAALFRVIDAVGGTLLLDEADFADSQVGADITKVLNNGYQQGSPITRMEKVGDTLEPRLFVPFGPKIINGRKPFRDDATESRCLTLATAQREEQIFQPNCLMPSMTRP